uniref:Uncharacterized protein n=1 Tax=Cyprinus carpio TaxID=7962 RepID=A0A8C1VAT9_CYPCA
MAFYCLHLTSYFPCFKFHKPPPSFSFPNHTIQCRFALPTLILTSVEPFVSGLNR